MNTALAAAVAIAANMQTMAAVVTVEECRAGPCVHVAQFELPTKYHQPGDLAMVEVVTNDSHVVKAEVLRYVGVQLRYKDLPVMREDR